MFVKTNEKCLTITKALAYYTMELITVVNVLCDTRYTPGACIIKQFAGIINYVTKKASVFAKGSKMWLTTKALAYYNTQWNMAVKCFTWQAPVALSKNYSRN